ncbi:thrombospondin type 3 repeat-containing protein [Halorussus salinisoli]|uniref:thrombospondin type 3 repeat-containing protein n=1 Tax=Halorussus salinisoli TaxID=2558242 RepID=UPI0010C168CC|nr:thrombospondin type 3 repeat-containing protein [Halorussus salinisoli]
MSRSTNRTIALLAIVLLVLSTVIVWDIAGERNRMATEAQKADAVSDQVTTRQAAGDYDGDGIGDSQDACPTRPETKNGFQDGDGCPDIVTTTGAS